MKFEDSQSYKNGLRRKNFEKKWEKNSANQMEPNQNFEFRAKFGIKLKSDKNWSQNMSRIENWV